MDLLDREGLPATAPAPVEDETTSPVEPPAPEGVFSPPLPPAEEKVDQASDSNATQPYEPHVDYEPVVAAPSLEMEADWFLWDLKGLGVELYCFVGNNPKTLLYNVLCITWLHC